MIKKKNKGIVFWLTGLPGSGKTTISSHLINNIRRKYGPTILISGDDIRKIFHLNGYKKLDRLKIGKKYFEFCRFFSDQGFNILINVVCLFKNIKTVGYSDFLYLIPDNIQSTKAETETDLISFIQELKRNDLLISKSVNKNSNFSIDFYSKEHGLSFENFNKNFYNKNITVFYFWKNIKNEKK